ncbi:MAG: cytochrome c biogenesis protein CcsA, partial [Anaerolineae bacterium]|nr:cytochrome c biogenesis protein CcsA [Anaerolineae bacterium]
MKSQPRLLLVVDAIALLALAVATAMVFFYAPVERVMGPVQKVFYFHVAAGWVGMLGFLAAVVAGVASLITRKSIWDLVGLGAIEIGLTFMLINIITGSIWARPIWNTWWTWDPRLTTATIMELVYAAYLMLRQGVEDPEKRARFGAVYAIIGFISVPLTFFSIRIYRTIHPVVIGGADPTVNGSFSMTPEMGTTF